MKKVLWMMLALTMCVLVLVSCGEEPPPLEICTVTFDANGGEFDEGEAKVTKQTTEGDVVDEPYAPTYEGYTFLGWSKTATAVDPNFWDFEDDIVDEDMTLYARWEPTKYNITYNGMTGASYETSKGNPSKYTIEESVTLRSPIKTAYVFEGWFNQAGERVTEIAVGTTGNIVLEARWTALEFAINYTGVEEATQNNNPTSYTIETAYTLVDPVRPGYRFDGWYKTNGTRVTSITPGTTGVLLLEARWIQLRYTITYYGLMGATHTNPEYFNTKDVIELTDPVLEGETFLGWYLDGAIVTGSLTGLTRNITLVARWQGYNTITYTGLTDGTHTNPEVYKPGYGVPTLSNAVKEGYTFLGWFDADGVRVTEISDSQTGDITLTAKWKIAEYTIHYEDMTGATNPNPNFYTIENQVVLKNPTRPHYTFLGWYDGNRRVTMIEIGSSGEVTLTARWQAITYTITYTGTDGATNTNPTTYTIESQITLAAPVRDGYTFSHWEDKDGNTVTEIAPGNSGKLVLIARWEGVYRVNYQGVENGTNSNPVEGNGASALILAAPTMDGATFLGWFDEDGEQVTVIPAGNEDDVTLTARWTPELVYTDDGNGGLIVSGIGDYAGIYLEIPATHNGKNVTGIAANAFFGNSTIVSVTIPASVTTIGQDAFRDCTALRTLVVGGGVTEMKAYAFRGCVALKTVVIEEGATTIGVFAFYGCCSLTEITVPDTVVSVGEAAFYGCVALTEIDLSEVTTLGEQVFYGCTNLTTVDISSTTTIGAFLFYGCSSLESITIPETVAKIGNYAFRGCRSLEEVVIPASVTEIGEGAFQLCASLESVTLGTGLNKIGRFAFAECESLASVTVTTTGWTYSDTASAAGTAADLSDAAAAAALISENSSKYFKRS